MAFRTTGGSHFVQERQPMFLNTVSSDLKRMVEANSSIF